MSTVAKSDLTNVDKHTIYDKIQDLLDFAKVDLSNVDKQVVYDKIQDLLNFAKVDLSNVNDSDILNKLKNVDGEGSGLDADLIRGLPADFSCDLSENGYTKLPNGLIIQWIKLTGTINNYNRFNINFPISFPNAVLGFGWMEAGSQGNWLIIKFDTYSTSGGYVALTTKNNSSDYAYQGFIIVIGY